MRIREAADEVDLNAYIPNKVAKDILSVMGAPLSKGETVPAPKDLRNFWKNVERSITGLNGNVRLPGLTSQGCHNLGPIILGETAYAVVK